MGVRSAALRLRIARSRVSGPAEPTDSVDSTRARPTHRGRRIGMARRGRLTRIAGGEGHGGSLRRCSIASLVTRASQRPRGLFEAHPGVSANQGEPPRSAPLAPMTRFAAIRLRNARSRANRIRWARGSGCRAAGRLTCIAGGDLGNRRHLRHCARLARASECAWPPEPHPSTSVQGSERVAEGGAALPRTGQSRATDQVSRLCAQTVRGARSARAGARQRARRRQRAARLSWR